MPLRRRGGGSGSGDTGLGPLQNTFGDDSTASRADAETLRNTYTNDAANATWLSRYNADRKLYILLRWVGGNEALQRRNVVGNGWEDVTGIIVGPTGTPGTAGAAGGGAIEDTGILIDGTGARAANEFIGTGLMLGNRGDTTYLLYRLVPDTLALLWFSTNQLYDIDRAAIGDTSTDGSGTVARTRVLLPESAGSSVSGSVHAGLADTGEMLLSTDTANVDITVEFFRYLPSDVQGIDEDRARELAAERFTDQEKARLAGVEAGATADQTGAEIKAVYEAEADTNAFTDALSGKLAGIAAGANSLTPYKIGNIYRGSPAGVVPDKPANFEGTATLAGITVAPAGWQLTRPEATEALPEVYDCHTYGYTINGVFSWQFGTPNRTDRYNPFTATLLAKLNAIEAGATADLTGSEIVALVTAALGSMAWQQGGTGGSDTAAQILAKLLTVDGVGSGLDADLLDGMTPAEVAALGVGGSFDLHDDVTDELTSLAATDRFLVSDENTAGDPNRYVTLTRLQDALVSAAYLTVTRNLTTVDRANELIQVALAAAVTGNTETNITVVHNADGTIDFVVDLPDEVTTAEAQAGTGTVSRLWTPQRVAQAITALAPGGTTTGLNQTQVDARVQAGLMAAVTGNTETGISVTYNTDGTVDFVVAATPTPTHTSYLAVSADTTFTEAEALAGTSGTGNALAVPDYNGSMHVGFIRPASEGDFTAVYIYTSGARNTQNQLTSWAQATAVLDVGGEDHNVLYSLDPLTGASGLIVEVL